MELKVKRSNLNKKKLLETIMAPLGIVKKSMTPMGIDKTRMTPMEPIRTSMASIEKSSPNKNGFHGTTNIQNKQAVLWIQIH